MREGHQDSEAKTELDGTIWTDVGVGPDFSVNLVPLRLVICETYKRLQCLQIFGSLVNVQSGQH